jgi:hypothetical protein
VSGGWRGGDAAHGAWFPFLAIAQGGWETGELTG